MRPWKRYPGWPARDIRNSTRSANLASPPAPKAPRKLTGPITGDAANGAKLVADRNRGGSCLACHVMGPAGNADLPGNVAPDLSEIGNAGREDEWLFNYVYDARVYNPETVMPPWGSHGFFNDQEINDMVAFLKTLKSPAVFKTALDDPSKRPAPVEKRDNLDPIENPGMWAVDKAQELWKQKSSIGFSCNTCHSDPKATFKTWAASMPKWEPRLNKVLGVEEFVTRHAKATTGADWLMETDENRAMSVYLHYPRQRRADQGRHHQRGGQGGDRARQGAEPAQGRPAQLRLHRLPRQSGQSLDPRPVAGRAEGPVRPLPDLAHQPAGDLGYPPALPVVPGQHPRRRAAARRQGIWRSRAVSRVAERRAEAQRAGHPALTSVRARA